MPLGDQAGIEAVKAINSETLPEAARLINELLSGATASLNSMLAKLYEVEADAITQFDASGNRMLDRVEGMLERGLEFKGTIGGIPFDSILTLKGNK